MMPTNWLDKLPRPAARNIAVHIKPAAERHLRGGHPWLFEGSITRQSRDGQLGDLAVIFDGKRRFLAVGLYDPDSPIRVKVLHHGTPQNIDRDFFQLKIDTLIKRRADLLKTDTNAYRLIHGENDGLPGLIVDRYADTLVIKLYTAGWLPHLRDVLPALEAVFPAERWVLRLARNITIENRYNIYDGMIIKGEPPEGPIQFRENGLTFAADVITGHKTGFFFDQRDNRARVRQLAQGRDVLDIFAYSGGFSVYAAAGGAKSVLSLDISEPALQAAQANMRLNTNDPNVAACQHQIMVADAFTGMAELTAQKRQFGLVVVDPPSFAKSADEIPGALIAYERLVRLALPLCKPGGWLVAASCSSRVKADTFFDTVQRVANNNGYTLKNMARTGHAIDHPVGFPEGAYLKCLFAQITP